MSENIETPEGWERSGPCFTRVYGGKFAVIDRGDDWSTWRVIVHLEWGDRDSSGWRPLPDAINWANFKLGAPKPVEVVEREFADGSVLVWREDGKASARVSPYLEQWFVDHGDGDYLGSKTEALEAARAYVRGDA